MRGRLPRVCAVRREIRRAGPGDPFHVGAEEAVVLEYPDEDLRLRVVLHDLIAPEAAMVGGEDLVGVDLGPRLPGVG